ncbi:UPF0619 GPI-anchored membrane protein [Penicillium soppii]|uniref:UPF0619 GPI-anchored membrane protein n=1 Tax=Penicillium soppii TaxID=69789 RepID=UPI00254993E1|nr:UPF0619 GPI-anchored membrane protein [Penicillium soppii]KAJ5852190.1 UPF0619 GPI-anchored membrane protein [Penicillium soppii]
MRLSITFLFAGLALTTTALKFKQPPQDLCVDITKPLTVQWTRSSDDPPNISFVLWNFSGASPDVNETYPVGQSPPLVVSTSLETYTLPAVSAELATQFSQNNKGMKYQINAVTAGQGQIQDQWGFFTVAKPGGGC